jgi:hypothetical protein
MDAAQQFLSELFYCLVAWLAILVGFIVVVGCCIYTAITERRLGQPKDKRQPEGKQKPDTASSATSSNPPPTASAIPPERPRGHCYCVTTFEDHAGHTYIFMWSESNFRPAVRRLLGMAADKAFTLTEEEAGQILQRMLRQKWAASCEEVKEVLADVQRELDAAAESKEW